jgi:hypothetical protein
VIWRAVGYATDVGDFRESYPMIWVLTAYLGLGILVNAASRSRPERLVMTPVALVLTACCLVLALA